MAVVTPSDVANIDPKEAIATVVINAIRVRGFERVTLWGGEQEHPLTMDMVVFAHWLRDAMKELDAVMAAQAREIE